MRNKKWAKPLLDSDTKLMIQNPEQFKGKWKDQFSGLSLCLEIGMGKGSYIQQMAKNNPNFGFIGVEKDRNCAAVALKDSLEKSIKNLKLINLDATNIDAWFAPKEIQTLYLNFSDPWPKKGHAKRRLSSSCFLEKYDTILSDEGQIVMKTDNKSLFEFSLISFLDYGYKLIELNVDFRSQYNDDPITEYEQKFMDLNQPIYRMIVGKKKGGKGE